MSYPSFRSGHLSTDVCPDVSVASHFENGHLICQTNRLLIIDFRWKTFSTLKIVLDIDEIYKVIYVTY